MEESSHPNHARYGIETQNQYNQALRLQESAFADIARRNSVHDLKTQQQRPMGNFPNPPRYHDEEEAAQIKRDEEYAIKLSMGSTGGLEDEQAPGRSGIYGNVQQPFEQRPPVAPSTSESNRSAGLGFVPPLNHVELYRNPNPFAAEAGSGLDHTTAPVHTPDLPPRTSLSDLHETPTFGRTGGRLGSTSLEPWSLNNPVYDLKSPSPRESLARCDQCMSEQPCVAYCPACSFNFCRDHWDGQILHKDQRLVNGVPHEKTDPHLAQRIKSIIEPSVTEEHQDQLHKKDDDATLFGVLPKPNTVGQLLFHDFGRYEEFLSQSMYTPKSGQFPSLISFVGPTGAGKSTIVKALVKLANLGGDNSKQQTPVVGLVQHQAVPTSGEVHLYWDPSSLVSNRPLMYADCEGLGGGSREPMAARATATKEKKVLTKDRREKESRSSQYESFDAKHSGLPPQKTMSGRNPNVRQRIPSYTSMSPSNTPMPPTPGSRRPSVSAIDTNSNSAMPSYSPYSAVDSQSESQDGWTAGSEKVYRGVTRKIKWAQDRDRRSRQFIVENLYPRILYTFSDIVILVMRNPK
jgi:flagellar biosynthesis GTPase FlhF